MYYFQSDSILTLLPYEVHEEDDGKVVVSTDEAAEDSNELVNSSTTNMERQSMSILWLSLLSKGLVREDCIQISDIISIITESAVAQRRSGKVGHGCASGGQ